MEVRFRFIFGLAAHTLVLILFLCSVTAIPTSTEPPSTEVKLESQDLEVVQHHHHHHHHQNSSSSAKESSLSYKFQCNVKGLTAEQVTKLAEEDEQDENVVISVYGAANSSNEDADLEGSMPYNIKLKAVNDTLVITGEIRSNKSVKEDNHGHGSLRITNCDAVFLNPNNRSRSIEDILENKSYSLNIETDGENYSPRHGPVDNKLVFYHKIDDLSQRSKRHMWLWRIKKIPENYGYDRYYGSGYGYPESPYYNRRHHGRRACSHGRHSDHSYRRHNRYPGGRYSGYSSEESGMDENGELQKLVNLIAERLDLADLVAIYKFDEDLPVEDLPREEIILDNMIRLAENRGLESRWARRFFCNQIEANKEIQYDLIDEWRREGCRPAGPPVDLRNDIRPRIDLINEELIELSKRTEYERGEWNCRKEVDRCTRYAAFRFDFDALHVRALQRATENVCERERYGSHSHYSSYPLFSRDSWESREREYYPF